jgi:3-oxoacyl-[acyl-carrier-protein] synthase II
MPAEVVVTGFGVTTVFGDGEETLLRNVFSGRPGFREVTRFDPTPYRCRWAAEGAATERQLDVVTRCARAALDMAGLEGSLSGDVLLGSSGDFTGLNRFWRGALRGEPEPDPSVVAESLPGHLVDQLAARLGIGGRRLAFNSGCVASSSAIIHGCELVLSGRSEMVVCGGCYMVDEEFFAKFDSGRALATEPWLRAFSADRRGLLLGDGGAVVVLELRGRAAARGARPLAAVAGWGMAADAHHVCQPHPQGAGLAAAMGAALRHAGRCPADVGYLNAHGTGTRLNDVAEARAIRAAFGRHAGSVPVGSTKSSTGHTLEAAGALEAIVSLLALRHGLLPPTVGCTAPDPECDLDLLLGEARRQPVEHALTVNSAFGGMNTAILLAAA